MEENKECAEKTELEKKLEAEAAAEAALEADAEQTPSEVQALTAEREALLDQLLRARAEFDNYRKRVLRDNERVRQTAAQSLMGDLLGVMDNLERSLAHAQDDSGGFAEGVAMVLKQMQDVLGRHGLQPIPAKGEAFDPNVHEAVAVVDTEEHPHGVVIEEFQKGYRLGDLVLRPSKVVVNTGSDSGSPAECDMEDEH